MEAHFVISRATKTQLQARVRELTQAYNELAMSSNRLSQDHVIYTAEQPLRAGETIRVVVPKRFMVSNA
jgi:hypothetical protein